jgi:hypothetical protein
MAGKGRAEPQLWVGQRSATHYRQTGARFTTSASTPVPAEDSPKIRSDLPAPPIDSGDAKLGTLTPDLPHEYFAPARKPKGE